MESRSQRDVRLHVKRPEKEEVVFNSTCGLCFLSGILSLTQCLDIVLPFTKGVVFYGSKEVFWGPLEVSFTEFAQEIRSSKFQNKSYF